MQSETYCHIYNHANGAENLFRSSENYLYFLRQWKKYITPIAETYSYCLMPNHFHGLIKLRPEHEVSKRMEFTDSLPFGKFGTFQRLVSKQFPNLFSSYTQAFNKMYSRKGSLFIPNFKRKEVSREYYLTRLIHYIHHNPIHHGFCENYQDWPHSSYHAFLSDKTTQIMRSFGLEWFGGLNQFILFHQQNIQYPKEIIFHEK